MIFCGDSSINELFTYHGVFTYYGVNIWEGLRGVSHTHGGVQCMCVHARVKTRARMCGTRLIHMDMTQSYVTWLFYMWNDSHILARLIHVGHVSFIWDMTQVGGERRWQMRRQWCRCVAVCCSKLQCIAVCCSVSQRVTMCCSASLTDATSVMWVCCSVLQCVAVCCSVLQCVAVCCSASSTDATSVM